MAADHGSGDNVTAITASMRESFSLSDLESDTTRDIRTERAVVQLYVLIGAYTPIVQR